MPVSGSGRSGYLCAGLGYGQVADRLGEPVRGELQGEPAVYVTDDRVLAHADAQRVLELVGQRVRR